MFDKFSVPRPRDSFAITTRDGAKICIRVHGVRGAPRLVLSHGNGFAIDAYLPFWRHLLPKFELVLFDFRNHGSNPYHGPEGHNWKTFVQDFDLVRKAISEKLGQTPTAGVFHSLSAITSLLHATEFDWHWEALVLFEPPILPPPDHPLHQEAREGEERVVKWAQTRSDRFRSPEELASEWRDKRAFRRWVSGTHSLMAESVLHRDPSSGEWILNCPRELEAKIYHENVHPQLWKQLSNLPGPILIIGGESTQETSDVPAKVARAIATEFKFDYVPVPNTTHLLMIEEPEVCAASVHEFLLRTRFIRE